MTSNLHKETVRINIHIPADTKEKLAAVASLKGKKISVLVRESIEEKIGRIERELLNEKMKIAYQEMAEENVITSEDFKYVDSENLA